MADRGEARRELDHCDTILKHLHGKLFGHIVGARLQLEVLFARDHAMTQFDEVVLVHLRLLNGYCSYVGYGTQ